MKSKICKVFVSSILGMMIILSSISFASDKHNLLTSVVTNTSEIAKKQVLKLVEVNSQNLNMLKADTYNMLINKPLLKLSSSTASEYIQSHNFTKQNRLFEFSTLFNDKLQQVIELFSVKETRKNKSHFIDNDKPKDNNVINCKA